MRQDQRNESLTILTIGLGLAIGVLALNALVTFWNIRNLIGSGRWVIHTREVLNAMDELLASVRDAESGSATTCSPAATRSLHRTDRSASRGRAGPRELGELTRDNTGSRPGSPTWPDGSGRGSSGPRRTAALRREGGLDAAGGPSSTAGTSGPTTTAPDARPR